MRYVGGAEASAEAKERCGVEAAGSRESRQEA
jgi:hypothetical protein